MTPIVAAPLDAPGAEAVMARAGGENFPVASRVLPRRARAHLLAVYGFARLVDELGDSFAGTAVAEALLEATSSQTSPDAAGELAQRRLDVLDWLEAELDRALAGESEHPLLARVGETARACSLSREPFVRLIEANRTDQRTRRYESWEHLRGYCALSADPVGEIVLGVFGVATPARVALSDNICTALQLAEHCQDVAEDLAAGRIYMPAEDMRRFGATERDLADAHAGPAVRELIAFEVARAHTLLDQGAPLLAQLHGRVRIAVAAFLAGGRAALEAIERAGYDVLAGPPRAGRLLRARALARTLRARARS